MGRSPRAQLDGGSVAALGLRAALHATSGMTAAADAFLRALRSGSPVKARSCLAREARGVLAGGSLLKLMSLEPIASLRQATFTDRHVSGDRGALAGTLMTTSGAVVPVRIDLVREEGAWKVSGFHAASP